MSNLRRVVEAVRELLDKHDYGPVVEQESLHGGITSQVLRLKFSDGRSLVYKESDHSQPGMYLSEQDGLNALRLEGCPQVPEVLSAGEDHLLIEDLGPQVDPPKGYWAAFGVQLAKLHSHTQEKFGYHRSNYLGTMLLPNDWTENGYDFFAETRLLFFLDKRKAGEAFTAEDRRNIERLAGKLPTLIPKQPASLTHGDLWLGNMLVANHEHPGLIDPAVYYGWPEADLALLPQFEAIPPEFWEAYTDKHPLEDGWKERFEILAVRDPICMTAEYGDIYDSVERVRAVLRKYV